MAYDLLDLGTGKFNLKLKNKIQPLVEAASRKRQAPSLTAATG